MALTIIPFLFQNLLRNPIKGVLLELNSVKESSYQNYFLQADFPCLKNFI
jgi:hypothetical protein